MLGPQQLIFKVVHFLIAVIMMQNQRHVAAEDASSGRKSQGVSCAALPRHQRRSASCYLPEPVLHTIPYFPSKRDSFICPLLSRVCCFCIQSRRNNKWSAQIKSAVALSIFQAGHAFFLFIQRVKAGRPPQPPPLLTIISFHLKNECACQGFFSSLSSCSKPPPHPLTHPSWLAPAITGGDSRGR